MAPKKSTTKPTGTTDEPTATKPPVLKTRVFAPMQSAGRIGKSTLTDLYLEWLRFAGVPYGAMDCDSEHTTLSDRYAGYVPPLEEGEPAEGIPVCSIEEEEAIRKLFGNIAAEAQADTIPPVLVIDFPAQATERIVSAIEQYNALEVLAGVGVRFTFPLILVDDKAAAESIGKIVNKLGDKADYIFVRNPARGASANVEQTGLVRRMLAAGTPVIDLAAVSKETMDKKVPAAEKRAGRFLPLAEVAKHVSDPFARMELESLIWTTACQLEDHENLFIPHGGLVQNRVDRAKYPQPGSQGRKAFGNKMGLTD